MGKGTRRGIWKVKRGIYNKAGLGNTRPKQRNESRSRCIRLYNKGSVVDKV